jgi:hypothetical protein
MIEALVDVAACEFGKAVVTRFMAYSVLPFLRGYFLPYMHLNDFQQCQVAAL